MVPFDKSKSLFAQNEDRALSPELLMPAQYYAPRPTSPYHNLLLATLGDAIRCFQHNLDAKTARRRNLFRETEHWLFEADSTAFMSCTTVCESLGIDSVALRRSLREWQRAMNAGSARRAWYARRVLLLHRNSTRGFFFAVAIGELGRASHRWEGDWWICASGAVQASAWSMRFFYWWR